MGFVVYDTLNISNLGGTITVHLFAAVYAIALSKMLFKPKDIAGNNLLATNYTSDGLGTIGKGFMDQREVHSDLWSRNPERDNYTLVILAFICGRSCW